MQHSDKKKKGKKAKRIPYKGDPFDLEESKRRGAAQVAEIKELLGLKEDEAFDESVDGFSTTGKKVKVKKTLELIVSKDSMDGKGSDKPKPEPTQGEKVMDKRIADEHTGYDPERLGEFPEHQPFHDRKVEEWDERQRGMFDQGDYQSFESKDREHWADRGVESDEKPDYADWLYEKFPDKEGLKKPRKDPLRKSLESMFKDAMTGSQSARGLPKQKEDEDFDAIEGILAEADVAADNQRLNTGTPRASEMYKSLEEIVRGDAEANPDMSPNEWLQWYKKRPKKKAEESNFGAGQRGLGYGNEGYTNVQGSGQSHTITEIPPEMEVIVHDVKDIKESKKEGYTTEAGNSKRGDPSRATDDDDSLLSQTFAKKDYKNTYIPLL
jgi:hypothetical protein